ncbi:hypothetical protein DLR58_02250 [Vibrio tarriae]|nr:hypothetical protein DLR58_02250 [Vibrio tarriae]
MPVRFRAIAQNRSSGSVDLYEPNKYGVFLRVYSNTQIIDKRFQYRMLMFTLSAEILAKFSRKVYFL